MQHVSVIIKTTIKLIREIYKLCLEDIFLLKMRGVNYEQKKRERLLWFIVGLVSNDMYWRRLVDLDTNKVLEK